MSSRARPATGSPTRPRPGRRSCVEIAAAKDRLPALSARARAFVEATYDTQANIDLYEARFRELAGLRGAGAGDGGAHRPAQ